MSRWKKKEEFELAERMRLLAEWYGSSVAGTELTAHSPQPAPISDYLDEFAAKIFSPEVALRIRLSENWEKIAGSQLAALTRVSLFADGELVLEVRHSAFLRELAGTEDLLLPRINAFLGNELCRKVSFSATGGPAAPVRRPRALGGGRRKENR